MKRFGTLLVLLCSTLAGVAQLEVDQNFTMEEYVNDILLGTGVEATNITYQGSELQIGFLTGGDGTVLPINQGLVLSTELPGNLLPGDDGNIPIDEGFDGDPDLLEIANSVPPLIGQNFTVSSVNDLCILEFDFLATGDTVSFNYVFASNEYLTYVNTQYNDIFGFFLSGPGITGPYASPVGFPDGSINIAGVPDSEPPLPITISSVNDVTNSQYYIDNPNDPDVDVNGFTTPFVASHPVQCGETYHIKLAIGDGVDWGFDSHVILEAGSFSSNAVVQIDLSIDVGGPDANTIYEDCGEAVLTFTRPEISILEIEEMVLITYEGEAENGVDYTLLPDTIIFPPGVASQSFDVTAVIDGIDEGAELVHFNILNLAACNGGGVTSSFEFYVNDIPEPMVVEGWDTDLCLGDVLTLEPVITGGYGNYGYDWSTAEDTPTIDVSPAESTEYFVTVSDTCGMPSDDASFMVTILNVSNLEVELDPAELIVGCDGMQVVANATGGLAPYEYYWYNEDDGNLWGFGNSLWVSTWTNAEEVNVEVNDVCGFTAVATATLEFDIPELIVDVPETLEVLCNESFTINPDVEGGGNFWYNWYVDGLWMDWQSTYTYSTDEDVVITVEVGDACGSFVTETIQVEVSSPELIIDLVDEVTGPCTEVFQFDAFISGGVPGYNIDWTDQAGANLGANNSIDYQSNESTTLYIEVGDQCSNSAMDSIVVTIDSPLPILELGDDVYASCVDLTQFDASVTDGVPDFEFEWMINGEVVSTSSSMNHQSYETVSIYCEVLDGCGNSDSDSLVYHIPDIPIEIELNEDTSICFGSAIVLHAVASGGEEGFTYFWPHSQETMLNVQVEPTHTTVFEVLATDICGTIGSAEVEVEVQSVDADFEMEFLSEVEVQFIPITDPDPCENCSYEWDFGDMTNSSEMAPVKEYDGLALYTAFLTVTNEIGCYDVVHHVVDAPLILYVPNAFTPDGDGINDTWFVTADGIVEYELFLFNRWGEVIWHSVDLDDVWVGGTQDATHYVPDGTYSYLIKYKGVNYDAQTKSGTVTIVR